MSLWPLRQDRCVDGAPTPRLPSCAGERSCPRARRARREGRQNLARPQIADCHR